MPRLHALYTLTSVCIFSILLLYISQETDHEKLINNQGLLLLVIISFINLINFNV